ncbi:unnamed protein product [Durusdinium trenchii]|uniref:Nitrile hydratase n=1 Tax=Durusdinium trenchii TaxID=1381693 RepID=A0ABP0LMI6_9DINO
MLRPACAVGRCQTLVPARSPKSGRYGVRRSLNTAASLAVCSQVTLRWFRMCRRPLPSASLPLRARGVCALAVDDGAGSAEQPGSQPGSFDSRDEPLKHWELQIHALVVVMISMEHVTSADLRGETCRLARYADWGYYGQWAVALAKVLLRNGLLSVSMLLPALGVSRTVSCKAQEFQVGQRVRVKRSLRGKPPSSWRRPHLPVPGTLDGACGEVAEILQPRSDPVFFIFCSELGVQVPAEICYTVKFALADISPGHLESPNPPKGSIRVEVFESWLQQDDQGEKELQTLEAKSSKSSSKGPKRRSLKQSLKTLTQEMHDLHSELVSQRRQNKSLPAAKHSHLQRSEVEQAAIDKEGAETPGQRLTEALIEVLTSSGIMGKAALSKAMEVIDSLGMQPLGPRIVARAWSDEEFKRQLLDNANEAIQSLDSLNLEKDRFSHVKVKVVESTDAVHNLVVCTLCSCYPVSLLGLSPSWYKSQEYRLHAVERPRELLKESFGLEIPPKVEIRVFDSNSDLRFFVLPRRPSNTEGWSEEELMNLVTRDSMIGVAMPTVPEL